VSREESARLQDILEAIERIRSYDGLVPAGASVMLVRDAILFRLVVIGEAVKDLSAESKQREPHIEWTGIAGMRDTLTHEYHRIDQGIVDEVVSNRLDELESACRRIVRML
jgi:uncharacterized protein with HEPN domain